jgi:hypothetical protein
MQTFLQVEVKKRVEQKTGHKIEWVEAMAGQWPSSASLKP